MQKPSVLFICSWYPSKRDPYLGNFIQRHAQSAALYAHITTISAHESEEAYIEEVEEKNVLEVRSYFVKKLPLLSYQNALRKAYLHLLSKGHSFDLIHLHVVYPAALFALTVKKPLLISEHFSGYHPISNHKWSTFGKWITQRALRKSKYVLPVSHHLGKAIKAFEPNISIEKISNAVDTSIFNYQGKSKNEVFTFLHVSTLEERSKNISGILRSFKKLSADYSGEFLLKIGGDGDISQLHQKIKTVGLPPERIETFGAQSSEGIAQLMREADCLLLFSNFENQPCVILEALCCGTPVLSSNVGGIPEEITNENGQLVPAGEEEALVKALQRMMATRENYSGAAIANKAQALYAMDRIGRQMHQLYLNVLNAGA